ADPFDIRHRTQAVQRLDYVAIALWIIAVLLFLYAAAAPSVAEAPPSRPTAPRAPGLRGPIAGWVATFPPRPDPAVGRVRWAMLIASLAAGVTVFALIYTAFPVSLDHDAVSLKLSSKEHAALQKLCGRRLSPLLEGSIPVETLERDFVTFTFKKE